jgi:hypothetical protein
MAGTIYNQLTSLKSCISFQPLLRLWKEAMADGDSVAAKICTGLHQRFSSVPELLQSIHDYSFLERHQSLIEEAMTTLFPPGFSKQKELYAVAMPFSSKAIYASSFFRETYLDSRNNYKLPLDPQVEKNVAIARVHLAYKLILKKWYGIELVGGNAFICSYPERERNIHNYFELEWDPQFIDITTSMELPPLPEEFLFRCHQVRDLANFPILATLLPLGQFVFEGLVITRIREVSERETVNNIQGILQKDTSLEDSQTLLEFQQQMQYLLRMEGVEIGLTAFYDVEPDVELPTVNFASVLLRNAENAAEVIDFCHHLSSELQDCPNWFWHLRNSDEQGGRAKQERTEKIVKHLEKDGWKNALITALYQDKKLIGCLELLTKNEVPLDARTLIRLEHVRDVLQTALQQYRQQVLNKISGLVKEHFTAVQTSVEWKFNNVAIRYLLQQHHGQTARMMPVVFENVYPLYGVIDIKNSSGERNKAIQQDLLKQLQWVKTIIDAVKQQLYYPLLQEVQSRINYYTAAVSNFLFAGDEQAIQHFLRTEVAELLQYIANASPSFRAEIGAYFQQTDNPIQLLNENRQKFEDSVTQINNSIIQYLETEQAMVQKVYPHYFERFVTDGVDFNLYIGQSIVPGKAFHAVHLKNLRLWQLHFLANAARKVHHLSASLHLPLQTTQLVLAYNEPIAIRFRNAERKFDVDGVHHARYEIVKKRIDKAAVKGSNERLTQPGTIAIVYSNDEQAKEYLQYIEYLKTQELVTGITELLEVEELQSVSGLKALRVAVQLKDAQQETDDVIQQSFLNKPVH